MTIGTGAVDLGSAYGEILVDMSKTEAQLRRAFDQVEQQAGNFFNRLSGNIQSAGDKLENVGKAWMKWTAPIAAVGTYGIKTFSQLEDALAEIKARTGATADEMASVQAMALKMGADTKYSATQAAEAMLQLLASGYDLNETFAALPAVLNAAAASGMDLGYTADVVTDALAMWKLGAKDADRVSNALARGAASSSAEINDLAQGLGNVGPIAAQFGLSIEDTIAILAAFSERGIKGAEAGTQLRSMLTHMTDNAEPVQTMWKSLGISMFDATGKARPLTSVLADLRVKMAGMSDEEQITTIKTLAGAYGQMGLAVLTDSDAMGDMLDLMGQQTDAATVAAARMDTLSGRTESLMGSIQAFLFTALGPMIEQYLKPAITRAMEFVNTLTRWVTINPTLTNQIVMLLAVLVGVGPALFAAGKALKLAGALLGGWGKAITLLTGPLGWLIAAGALLYLAWKKNFMGIQGVVPEVLDTLGSGFDQLSRMYNVLSSEFERGGLLQVIRSLFGGVMIEDLLRSFGVGEDAARAFGNTISDVFQVIYPALETFYNWFVTDGLPAIVKLITEHAIPLFSSFFNTFIQAWLIVEPALKKFADWFVRDALPAILKFISEKAIPAIGWLLDQVKGIWDYTSPYLLKFLDWMVNTGLPVAIRFVSDDVIPAIGALIDWLKKIWDDVQPNLAAFYDWAVNTGLPAINSAFNWLKDNVIGPAIEKLKDLWDDAEPKLAALYNWVVNTGLPAINNAWNSFKNDVIQPVIEKIKSIWDQISPTLSNLKSGFADAFGWIKDKIQPVIDAIDDVIEAYNELKGLLPGGNNGSSQSLIGKYAQTIQPSANSEYISGTGSFGTGSSSLNSLTATATRIRDLLNGKSFARGRYTGDAPVDQVVGVVHGQEWVIPHEGSPIVFAGGLLERVSALFGRVNDIAAMLSPSGSFVPSMAGVGAGGGGSAIYIGRVDVPVSVDTMSQYPDGEQYGRKVAAGFESQLEAEMHKRGGGNFGVW